MKSIKQILTSTTIYKIYKERETLKYIEELKRMIQKDGLRDVLFEMMFPFDYQEPIDLKERYRIFSEMSKNKDIMKLLQSRYTRNYQAYFSAKDNEERFILKGRMLELQDMIRTIPISSKIYGEWDKYKEESKIKANIKKGIKKYFGDNNT